jgi:hypothetical protein
MKITGTSYIAKIEISTTAYQFSHGKKPSGRGYWAFVFKDIHNQETIEFMPGHLRPAGATTYGEAKKWAIRHGAELGSVKVSVAT